MNYEQPFIVTILLIGACMLPLAPAHSDTVLYDGSGFLAGTQSFEESFNLPSAGTLTVTLSNVAWPEQLASLNLLLTSVGGTLGPEMGAGTATFNIAAGTHLGVFKITSALLHDQAHRAFARGDFGSDQRR